MTAVHSLARVACVIMKVILAFEPEDATSKLKRCLYLTHIPFADEACPTLLCIAIQRGACMRVILYLALFGAGGVDSYSYITATLTASALGTAARLGRVDVIKALVTGCGASLELQNSRGETPLVAALRAKKGLAVNALLELGAQVPERSCYCHMSYNCAAERECRCAEKQCFCDAASLAATHGFAYAVRYMVTNCGLDPHRHSKADGCTLLCNAVCSGNLQLVRMLVDECGVDLSSTGSHDHCRSAHFAAVYGHIRVAKYLLSQGKTPRKSTLTLQGGTVMRLRDIFDSSSTRKMFLSKCSTTGCPMVAVRKCERCNARYCNKKCQVSHWCAHKDACQHVQAVLSLD